jgi:hexokinase
LPQAQILNWRPLTDLGEITRNILLHFIDLGALFGGWSTKQLNSHYGLDTAVMSAIEAAADLPAQSSSSSSSEKTSGAALKKIIHKDLGVQLDRISDDDIAIVTWAVRAVGTRAAAMSATVIAAIVKQTEGNKKTSTSEDIIDIGIDGSVAELYPHFQERVREVLVTLLGEKTAKRIRIGLAKDGSGVGGRSRTSVAVKLDER